ncbi:cobalamin biosynthesis protein CbiX [Tabrizicola sp. DMG-N-6]|uniref:Cobalamin biosynthesis protein CbiX n=1 Tax=Szabonella alba TaxID=2804194 RepID=A0A8K0XYH7_9RHOB|nr:cobalamin biosynthesis protein CbiX [Szabonella alba]
MLQAILVAHGAPADPDPQEAAMAALANRVAASLPGWQIRGATLAAPDALEGAVAALPDALIYPFFMAEGWFTKTNLPKRLNACGGGGMRQLRPFGADPALPDLMITVAGRAAQEAGIAPDRAALLLAAHGSQVSRSSAEMTEALAGLMRERAGFARVVMGFVEEAPFLQDAARGLGPAICLPLFALSAGHVTGDVPEALAEAEFAPEGVLLPPIGAAAGVPALIAAALARSVSS